MDDLVYGRYGRKVQDMNINRRHDSTILERQWHGAGANSVDGTNFCSTLLQLAAAITKP